MNLEIVKKIKQLIEKDNLIELKNFFIFNNINVNVKSENSNFNSLIYAIENNASNDLISFLIKEYSSLNFDFENKSPLFSALLHNNYYIANLLINYGSDINYCNKDSDNALIYLIKSNSLTTKKLLFLLHKGININYEDKSKKRFLEYVFENHYLEWVILIFNFYIYNPQYIIELLTIYINKSSLDQIKLEKIIKENNSKIQITKSIYLSALDSSDVTIVDFLLKHADNSVMDDITHHYGLLLRAAENDDLEMSTFLLNYGVDINEKNEYDETSLIIAARNGNFEMVKLFIDNGADINAIGEFNYTALMFAASNGHLNTVKLLMEHGAKADVKNVNELTAYNLASLNGYNDVVKYFIENNVNVNEVHGSALMGAASRGDMDMIKFLFEGKKDISINETDAYDWTPLMLASEKGHLEVVQFLVEKGADVNHKSENSGNTAFTVAFENKYYEVMSYLLEHGAHIDEKDNENCTPLMSASRIGNLTAVQFLIEHGANINEKDMFEWTPLMYASEKGHFPVVKYLIEHGANINFKSSNRGYTAFLNAFEDRDLQVISYLIEHGANINDKDNEGYTALMYVSAYGDMELVRFLVEHGIEINSRNNHNETALLIAVNNQKLDVAQYLIDHDAVVYIAHPEHGLMEYRISIEPQPQ